MEKKQPSKMNILLVGWIVLGTAAVAALLLLRPYWLNNGAQNAVPAQQEQTGQPEETPPEVDDGENETTETTSGQAVDAAPTNPETWNEAGRTVLENLMANEPQLGLTAKTLHAKPGFPYLIAVNRAASCVTVYAVDEAGDYTLPYLAMICSGGSDTPTGFFNTMVNYNWRLLYGPCYGQYATRIHGSYLFHSVPYYTQHQDDVEYDEFNQLGTPASLGCIRLMVVDVKWIYDNCPVGTPVLIYDDAENPGPMGKPGRFVLDPSDETTRGWDPTDPNEENPWPAEYRVGTTLRSAAAQTEWDKAQEEGSWQQSRNPTDLQGFSTDSAVEGTRG